MVLKDIWKRSIPLYTKTGLLFSLMFLVYTLLSVLSLKLANPKPSMPPSPAIILMGVCSVLFLITALFKSLHWCQPVLLLIITPFPMTTDSHSMLSLGFFIAGEILLFQQGFFNRRRVAKYSITISYFYLCEALMGITAGNNLFAIISPILFLTSFLGFLMIVFGERWIVYLKEPKPVLSLASMNLTRMETAYLRSLTQGHSIKEIAIDDGVKESTVRNTLARVYRKFKVPDKAALLAKCENYRIED